MIPQQKMSQFCSKRIGNDIKSCFVFKFHRNWLPGRDDTMLCYGDKKVHKMRFFAAILRSVGARRQKFAEKHAN